MRALLLTVAIAFSAVGSAGAAPADPMPDGYRRPQTFVDLAYPREALDARVQGFVVVDVDIDDRGRVSASRVLAGHPMLAEPSAANVGQWTFEPYAGRTAVVYRFDIDPAKCHDDTRSLFRLESPTLATITTCSASGRAPAKWPDDGVYVERLPSVDYPQLAYSAGVWGTVVVRQVLNAKGSVESAAVLAGPPLLAYAAADNAKSWKYSPSRRREAVVVYEFVMDRLMPLENCAMASAYEIRYPNYIRLAVSRRCIDISSQPAPARDQYQHED